MNGSKTIGLLTSWIYSTYNMEIWSGAERGARARGYSLVTYRGNAVGYDAAAGKLVRNVVYDAIDMESVDGLLLVSSSIANEAPAAAYRDFCARFRSKPLVSIGPSPDFARSCLVDNSSGFYELVSHLISAHGCSSFVYLGGPEGSQEAKVRYAAFRKALEDAGVAFNEKLFRYGNFRIGMSKEAMKELLDSKIAFDAVVAANDDMAIAAVETLRDAGYRVPDDVKVVGFDDAPKALAADPPLSTVRQPLFSQAFRAVNMLIDAIEGRPVGMEEYIETMPVIRRSCGCGTGDAAAADERSSLIKSFIFGKAERDRIVRTIREKSKHTLYGEDAARAEGLVDAFERDLSKRDGSFSDALRAVLDGVEGISEIDLWKEVLSVIEKSFRDCLSEDRVAAYRGLVKEKEGLINEKIMRIQSQKYAAAAFENSNLREILQGLGYNFNIADIHEFMSRNFKNRLGIQSGLLFLFEKGSDQDGRVIAGYDQGGKWNLEERGGIVSSKKILKDCLRDISGKSYFICPINFNEEDLGLTVLQTGAAAPFIYESVAAQLASSVWGSFLLRNSEEYAKRIAAQNYEIESLVKPMIESIRRVTEITEARLKTIALLNDQSVASSAKISETFATIRGVSEEFEKMLGIIGIFEDISMTVSLVSINASIEASHAGHFGAGFKVLAKEIKKLSESTRQNADSISKTLRAVVGMVRTSIGASEESAASFRAQEALMNEILDSMRTISGSMTSLDEGSSRILSLMDAD